MRKIGIMVASFAALMMLIGTTNTADAKNGYGKQKVAYHINYPGGPKDKKYITHNKAGPNRGLYIPD